MKTGKHFDHVGFVGFIHTLEVELYQPTLCKEAMEEKSFVKRVSHYDPDRAVCQINPHKFYSRDDDEWITNLSTLEHILSLIWNELPSLGCAFRRIDFSFSSTVPFEELQKISSYFKELYALHIRSTNSFHTTGDDLHRRSLKVIGGRRCELEIYDKRRESKGKSPYKTRAEFRYKQLQNKSIGEILIQLHQDLACLPFYMDSLVELKVAHLCAQYQREQAASYEGRTPSFTAYVCKYAEFIYNRSILEGLYGQYYPGKSNLRDWLNGYRRSGRTLTLYTKAALCNYIQQMEKALCVFENECEILHHYTETQDADLY